MTDPILPPGYTLRPTRWDDLEQVTQLIYDVCLNDGDATMAVSAEELRDEWQAPGFDPVTQTWVVTSPEGRVVGYEEFSNRFAHAFLQGDGYVHPEHMGKGIGTSLLRALDARARQEMDQTEPDLRVFIRNGMAMGDTVARTMHENEGYQPIRFFWRMETTLEALPPAPAFPAGIELRPFDHESQAELLYHAHEEAFSDHWGYTPRSYEEWSHRVFSGDELDQTLYFIAWDGGQIAGYALCRYRMGNGRVNTLGVRRSWRKRGLGMALLQHAFRAFYERGTPTVTLGVDAANPNGATRLYQKAGMHVASEFVTYEKELRPGRDVTDD